MQRVTAKDLRVPFTMLEPIHRRIPVPMRDPTILDGPLLLL